MAETPQMTSVRIVCINPPDASYEGRPAVFGLLDRQSHLHPGQPQPDGSLVFEAAAQVVTQTKTGTPSLKGDAIWVQGPSRFFYLAYRHVDSTDYIRRLKVSLKGLTWAHVNALQADATRVLTVTVDGSGAATVPLLDGGWRVV